MYLSHVTLFASDLHRRTVRYVDPRDIRHGTCGADRWRGRHHAVRLHPPEHNVTLPDDEEDVCQLRTRVVRGHAENTDESKEGTGFITAAPIYTACDRNVSIRV